MWKPPEFSSIFETYAKRPAHLVRKRTVLFNQGDPLLNLYFIKEGFVKLYQLSEEGRETVIYLCCPGDLLGVRALTSEERCARHFGETITDAKISTLTFDEFNNAVNDHPEFLIDIMHVFINRLNHAESRLNGFIATDVQTRVANFLHDCALRFGEKDSEGISLPLPLTHQRISEFVGSFRETVTHVIKKMEDENILIINRGKIRILDSKKLYKLANPHKEL